MFSNNQLFALWNVKNNVKNDRDVKIHNLILPEQQPKN